MSFQIKTIPKSHTAWKVLTTEIYRIDEHELKQLCNSKFLQDCSSWITGVLFNSKSDAHLTLTTHLWLRTWQYKGTLSKCGNYIELYENETLLMQRLPDLLNYKSQYEVVEIGFNHKKQVCKLALLLPFSQWLTYEEPKLETRKLFLLVGCDGGLKTFYSVPDIKWRRKYRMDSTISPITAEEILKAEKETVTDNGWTIAGRNKK